MSHPLRVTSKLYTLTRSCTTFTKLLIPLGQLTLQIEDKCPNDPAMPISNTFVQVIRSFIKASELYKGNGTTTTVPLLDLHISYLLYSKLGSIHKLTTHNKDKCPCDPAMINITQWYLYSKQTMPWIVSYFQSRTPLLHFRVNTCRQVTSRTSLTQYMQAGDRQNITHTIYAGRWQAEHHSHNICRQVTGRTSLTQYMQAGDRPNLTPHNIYRQVTGRTSLTQYMQVGDRQNIIHTIYAGRWLAEHHLHNICRQVTDKTSFTQYMQAGDRQNIIHTIYAGRWLAAHHSHNICRQVTDKTSFTQYMQAGDWQNIAYTIYAGRWQAEHHSPTIYASRGQAEHHSHNICRQVTGRTSLTQYMQAGDRQNITHTIYAGSG